SRQRGREVAGRQCRLCPGACSRPHTGAGGAVMIEHLRSLLRSSDPSLPLAVAALLATPSADGTASFEALAVAYREDHLELQRSEFGDTGGGGQLSVGEVRRHLEESVLPRLVSGGVLEPLTTPLADESPVRLRTEVRDEVSRDPAS